MLPHHHAGEGPPLLLVHGLGGCWQHWLPILSTLEEHHEVSAIDLPGFGSADPLPGRSTIANLADAVEAHLDDLGWTRAHMAGNSLGGLTVLELARRGRALTATALSPAGMADGWHEVWSRSLLRVTRAAGRAARSAVLPLFRYRPVRRALTGGHLADLTDVEPDLATAITEAFFQAPAFHDALDALDAENTTDRLQDIRCAVTIGWGSRDRLLFPSQGLEFKRARPDFRLVRLPGAGHVPMFDAPETTASVILETSRL